MKTGKRFNLKDFLKENWIALIPYVMFVIMFAVMGVLNSSTLTLRYIANKMAVLIFR